MKPPAHVLIVDDTNTPVWTGSLRDFFVENRTDRNERRRICEELRPSISSHLQEPVFIGGGAGVEFKLQLFEERVRPRRRCAHGQWVFLCMECQPIAPIAVVTEIPVERFREIDDARREIEAITGIDQRATERLNRGLRRAWGLKP